MTALFVWTDYLLAWSNCSQNITYMY